MNIHEKWPEIKKLFKSSFRSSLHFSIATIDREGNPHITPIGSLILGDPCKAIYFEEFTRRLPSNSEDKKQICVLAVNSSKYFWFKSLISGKFLETPAIRLYGKMGVRREATEREIVLWNNRVRAVSFTKGHDMMWANMKTVREIEFDKAEPVHMGQITKNAIHKLSPKNV